MRRMIAHISWQAKTLSGVAGSVRSWLPAWQEAEKVLLIHSQCMLLDVPSALLVAMAITAGLKVNIADVVGAFHRPRHMILELILNFVVIPAVAIGLIQFLNAPPLVAAGVLILAVCPGAPFALPGTAVAHGDVPFAVGLMMCNVVLSVVIAPLLLGFLLGGIPGAENRKSTTWRSSSRCSRPRSFRLH